MRYLSIPKNEEGITEYDAGVESSDNLLCFELPDNEFNVLMDSYIFFKINDKFKTIISDYESEVLNVDICKFTIDEITNNNINVPITQKCLGLAIDYNSFLALDF